MTIYNENPVEVALDFKRCGAKYMHVVDLEGAKNGKTPNIETIKRLTAIDGMFVEVGGGIRNLDAILTYLEAGADRVILGTAAVEDRQFLLRAVKLFGDKIAVGVDIKDGYVATNGWTQTSDLEAIAFCKDMQSIGVKTIICTDISRDGAMKGTNHALYETLKQNLNIDVIASGGVSNISDVERLAKLGICGAIIGKAYYTKAIDLREALEVAHGN